MSVDSIGQTFIWFAYFETPFLKSSKEYYLSQYENFVKESSPNFMVVEYLRKIEELWSLEQERFTDMLTITNSKVFLFRKKYAKTLFLAQRSVYNKSYCAKAGYFYIRVSGYCVSSGWFALL
jgi:hypothetical protein